jgi:hypothetical protein
MRQATDAGVEERRVFNVGSLFNVVMLVSKQWVLDRGQQKEAVDTAGLHGHWMGLILGRKE